MHYCELISLIGSFVEACTEPESPIECLIGFVADCSINSIKRPADDDIGSWYHGVSRRESTMPRSDKNIGLSSF